MLAINIIAVRIEKKSWRRIGENQMLKRSNWQCMKKEKTMSDDAASSTQRLEKEEGYSLANEISRAWAWAGMSGKL